MNYLMFLIQINFINRLNFLNYSHFGCINQNYDIGFNCIILGVLF